MPLAVTLRATDGRPLQALADAAAAFEATPSMAALGYAPHLTLAVYETIERTALAAAADAAFSEGTAVTLTFDRIASFEGPPLVLWAAPRPAAQIMAMHAALHRCIDPALCHPHYRPGAWVPHATLAMAVRPEQRGAALDWAARPRPAFRVKFDRGDEVQFPPVELLAERSLSGS